MSHRASRRFWQAYRGLPAEVQLLAKVRREGWSKALRRLERELVPTGLNLEPYITIG